MREEGSGEGDRWTGWAGEREREEGEGMEGRRKGGRQNMNIKKGGS